MAKTKFLQKLKNETFVKKRFFDLKVIFFKRNLKHKNKK